MSTLIALSRVATTSNPFVFFFFFFFFHSTYHHLTVLFSVLFILSFPTRIFMGTGFVPAYSLMSLQQPTWYPAHSRVSINVYRMSESAVATDPRLFLREKLTGSQTPLLFFLIQSYLVVPFRQFLCLPPSPQMRVLGGNLPASRRGESVAGHFVTRRQDFSSGSGIFPKPCRELVFM